MSDLNLIAHRNQLMVKMYWILFFIGLSLSSYFDTSMAIVLVITALPPMLLISYFVNKLQFPKLTMYMISTLFIAELIGMNIMVADYINLFYLILPPIVSVLYRNWKYILFNTSASAGAFSYFLYLNGQNYYFDWAPTDLYHFLVFFIIFGGLVIYEALFSESIRKRLTSELNRVIQLQNQLYENEKRFKAMVKQSSDGIFAFNPKTKMVVETNEQFCRMLGYDEQELLNLSITEFIISDDSTIEENINSVLTKDRYFIGDKLYRRKDGSLILVEVSGSIIHLQDESFILANIRDITDRMEAEALIQKQGRLLNGVAEAMNCLLTNENQHFAIQEALEIIGRSVGVDRIYIFENHLYENKMVMSQRYEWAISEKLTTLYDRELHNIPYSNMGECWWYKELCAGRVIHGPIQNFPVEERVLFENQTIKSLLLVPIFILDKFWGFIGFDDCNKVRNWNKSEESILLAAAAGIGGAIKLNQDAVLLQESETKYRLLSARLEALISHMHYGILAVDKDSRLMLTNQRFKEIFHLPMNSQLFGEKHIDFIQGNIDLYNDKDALKSRTENIIASRSKILGDEWQLSDGRTISRDAIPIFTNNQFDGYLWLFNDITKQKLLEQQLTEASILDGLTNIYNRRYFDENILTEWKRCLRNEQPITLIMLDIDCFKDFNDTYGHQSGDRCLKVVAQTIKDSLRRTSDIACRYGGEEFAVILPDTHKDGGLLIAEKISKEIELLQIPHTTSDVSNVVTCSIGVATITPNLLSGPQELINLADQALYQSKHSGRNCVSF